MAGTKVASIYELSARDLHNNDVKLSTFDNNQVLLIVNFSTSDDLCEKNLLELKDLKLKYCDDISILLFPSSQFGDPMAERDNSEIYCWCKFEGIEFAQVFGMVDVNGPGAHPLFQFLTQQKPPQSIEWNFAKFLVDRRGQVIERFSHKDSFADIEGALKLLL